MKAHIFVFTLLCLLLAGAAQAQTVYITKTGTAFHQKGCQHLGKGSQTINFGDAKNKGLKPCGTCKPEIKQANNSVTKANVQCSGKTADGKRCMRMTAEKNGKCWQHK